MFDLMYDALDTGLGDFEQWSHTHQQQADLFDAQYSAMEESMRITDMQQQQMEQQRRLWNGGRW